MLDKWNEKRKKIAANYLNLLEGANFILPYVPEWADPVRHLFVVRTSHRAELQAHLTSQGVGTMIHYPIPPHLQSAYVELGIKKGHLIISEQLHCEVLSLPIFPHLTLEQVERVVIACRFEALD